MGARGEAGGVVYRFGPFELDVAEKELKKLGRRIRLQGQPFLVLTRLLENSNRLVTRDELKQELWPADTFVDFEHSLNEAVNKVRTALGDSASKPAYVETVPRHGYRFIAAVERQGDAGEPQAARAPRGKLWLGVPLVAAALVVGLFLRRDAPPIRSLAVLPFDNLSGDAAQDYVSDGLTDELTAQLTRIPDLRVISRTSARRYKGSDAPLSEIGRKLSVDALVEGSVHVTEGNVRITVELVEAASDRSLWTDTYEGTSDRLREIQNEVARSILREVRDRFSVKDEARLAGREVPPRAYHAYLKGRHHWNQRTEKDFLRAVEYFTEATSIEPTYAEAYAGLADTYQSLSVYNLQRPETAMPRAKAAVMEALRIDPALAAAHASLGAILFLYDWDWAESERELQKAIELDPGYAATYQWFGVFLAAMNRPDEAIERIRHAVSLDPLSLSMNENLGWAYYVARRYPEAIEQFEATLELDPEFGQALRYRGLTLLQLGRHEEALESFTRARHAFEGEPENQADLALANALAGRPEEAERLLKELTEASAERYVSPFLIASFHAGLGSLEPALDWLEKACDERVANVVFLGVDPAFDSLRAHPRFQTLLARIGL
jgi:TolB-like protein/DNA-binding winged helix-turn-helix (wHTH) protein/Tfp pilus assembly protein PilF